MKMPSQEQIGQFLSQLEAEEAKFLSWGYVDGGFSEEEVYQRAEDWIANQEWDIRPNHLIDAMYEQRLLMPIPYLGRTVWRTRMAETVRLLVRLRQMLPNHKSWKEARTLVSDFRFHLQERRYPKRNQSKQQVLEELNSYATTLEQEVLNELLPGHFQLSRFQVQSSVQMLQDLHAGVSCGMIVCAGTGTGKTMSFYLPALSRIAEQMVNKPGRWTKGLALYPRNELLKDQFMETYQQARRLDQWLLARTGRKLKIGAYFGPTPESADKVGKNWGEDFGGYVCPFMRCPGHPDRPDQECNAPLVWKTEDVKAGRERLICANGNCRHEIGGDEVALTRDNMRNQPPDLLFTTTEMMNRSLSDLKSRKAFGVQATYPPEIMLLDEVHTYTGVHGAQVALLLRRWTHALQSPVHFTGLSATLKEAGDFFAELTGLSRARVAEITADENTDEMVSEGKEYQVILRGDPVSGTSLLSTTIQTAMLMRRMLDLPKHHPSNGTFGERVFVFTDDLDVTNRLFHSLLDAEAWKSEKEKNVRKEPLAVLRQPERGDAQQRLEQGQSWWYAQEIGHQLGNRLVLGRTSSQDAGVRIGADLIVATASLEVGYNDPNVGAVIQHKAPMDMASFLQRKGRAGRKRGMRPWTVTVLTDFGRDRTLYQGYEMLIDPVFERRRLPIRNRYVLKMQAVFGLMDWMAEELNGQRVPAGSLWNDFSAPAMYLGGEERQKVAVEVVRKLLQDKYYRRHLENYLKKALGITQDELAAVLWEAPRALMLNVLPMLLRRLESGWRQYVANNSSARQDHLLEPHKFGEPLREFIPSKLFSNLNLPEIRVILPPMKGRSEEEHPYLPIASAMKLLAPGRVTRRFGYRWANESHWIQPPSLQPSREPQYLSIAQFSHSFEDLGDFQMMDGEQVMSIPCLRPREFRVERTDHRQVKVTSNAQLVWKSQLFPTRQPDSENRALQAEAPFGSKWRSIIHSIRFYTHNLRSEVTVRRFTLGSDATIKLHPNVTVEMPIRYSDERGTPVALGFEQQVDGICFRFQMLERTFSFSKLISVELLSSTRTAYFHYRVMKESRLDGVVNVFQRERLTETYLSALSSKAMRTKQTLQDAWQEWQAMPEQFVIDMDEVFRVIFQALPDNQNEDAEYDEAEEEQKLQVVHEELLALCEDASVSCVLHQLAHVLWEEPDEEWNRWMQEKWKCTLGSALLQACKAVTPEVQNDDIILDIEGGPRPHESQPLPEGVEEIWITETAVGGGGVVEEIIRRYYADPRRFFRLVESALDPSDLELIDTEMTRVLQLAHDNADMRGQLQEIRTASGYEAAEEAMTALHNLLRENGVLMTHGVISSLYNRLLRPGSSNYTDELMYQLINIWRVEEKRLGIELDARAFAYVFSQNDEIAERFENTFQHIEAATVHDAHWRFQVIYSLLWPRGQQNRSKALEHYNPFSKTVSGDREVLLQTLSQESQIDFRDAVWAEQVALQLSTNGIVHLMAPLELVSELKVALLKVAVQPIDAGFLHVFPRVEGVRREADRVVVTLDIREAVQ